MKNGVDNGGTDSTSQCESTQVHGNCNDGWFTILETQFHLWNVTAPKTKFYIEVLFLPSEELAKLPNATLESQAYEELNRTRIKAYERTKPKLLGKLMSLKTILGWLPAYLHEMLSAVKHIGISKSISKAQVSSMTAINNVSSNCLVKRLESYPTWLIGGWWTNAITG